MKIQGIQRKSGKWEKRKKEESEEECKDRKK